MNLKQKLASGVPLLGTFLKTPSPMVCEVLARTNVDLVCIDAEHAPFDRADINACVHAFQAVEMPCIVRIPATNAEHILNALDCGANGILAPHIVDAASAKHIVNKSQYGKGRGFAGSSRAAGYTTKSMAEHKADSNATTVVIAQIEDREALDDLDAIFAIPGIDCFFIGRADLTISMGLDNPKDRRVIEVVEDICRRGAAAGQRIGMFTGNIEEIPQWRELGVSLFLLSSDHSFLLQGAAAFTKNVREYF